MHLNGPTVVTIDGDEATASTPFVFLSGASGKPEPVGMGHYVDTCRGVPRTAVSSRAWPGTWTDGRDVEPMQNLLLGDRILNQNVSFSDRRFAPDRVS